MEGGAWQRGSQAARNPDPVKVTTVPPLVGPEAGLMLVMVYLSAAWAGYDTTVRAHGAKDRSAAPPSPSAAITRTGRQYQRQCT